MEASQRNRVVVWWEDLPIGVQIAVVLPVAVTAIWAAHVWLVGLTFGRAFTYAGFWRRAPSARAAGLASRSA